MNIAREHIAFNFVQILHSIPFGCVDLLSVAFSSLHKMNKVENQMRQDESENDDGLCIRCFEGVRYFFY